MRNVHGFWKGLFYLLPVLLIIAGTTVSASAYDVSGTISYSGLKSGRIHISLERSTGLGTSIPAPGLFTIRGAVNSTFSIKAYMETAGSPMQHASSPVSYSGAFSRTDVPDL